MKNIKITIFLIVLLFWSTGICQNTGTTGATFLKLGAGARAIGMGSAFTGVADDATAMYWNPAGLGLIKWWELSFNYQRLFADFEYFSFFGSHQFRGLGTKKAALGIGLLYLGLKNDWDSTNGKMPAISANDVSDMALIVPFAYRLDVISPKLSLGLNYKYIKSKLVDYSSQAHGLDFGVLYKTNVFNGVFLSLGTCLQNVTLKKVKFINEADNLPLTLRAGSALKFYLTNNQDITLAYDFSKTQDNTVKHNLGLEYWLYLGRQRFGVRGGYRFLNDDLGKLSFSLGYGLDISQIDYALHNYENNVLGNVDLGSFSLKALNPDPFRRLSPEQNAEFFGQSSYVLKWEPTYDSDDHDYVQYFIVVDTSFTKVDSIKNNARKAIQDALVDKASLPVLFCETTSSTSTRFNFKEMADIQTFYWVVIAYDRDRHITVGTGSDEIGKFTNKNLPDIEPISLKFISPYTTIDTSSYQGKLEAKIIGKIKKKCQVVLYDSTDSKIIYTHVIDQLSAADTATFEAEWRTPTSGWHSIAVIADFGNEIAERNENNNVLTRTIATVPKGTIAADDTVKLEELTYEYIELPTIPYFFFEPNSVEFSKSSMVDNETHPDSVLKLLGNRLRDYAGLNIILKGYIDKESEHSISGQNRLSYLRAQKIKEKLIEHGARESQIIISKDHADTEVLLERKSVWLDSSEIEMVNTENRRVELTLTTNLPEARRVAYEKLFFAPRKITRATNEFLSRKIPFRCQLVSPVELEHLTITIRDYRKDPFPVKILEVDLRDKSGDFSVEWDGVKNNGKLIAFNKNYYYFATVRDVNGNEYQLPETAEFYLQRDVVILQKRIYALARFDDVRPLHQFYVEQLNQVEDMMKKNPRIRVRFVGHTDAIGLEEYNQRLSVERALALSAELNNLIDIDYELSEARKKELKSRIDVPIPRGEDYPLTAKNIVYGNNDSPQGRTLNRRVDIEVYRMEEYKKPILAIEKNLTFPTPIDSTYSNIVVAPTEAQDSLGTTSVEMLSSLMNKITSVEVQDSVIWLGTENGLVRWDVSIDVFEVFSLDLEKYKRITCLKYDPGEECLWVGTLKGIRKFDGQNWSDFNVTHGLSGNIINSILIDRNGNILVGTNEGVNIYDGQRWRIFANIDSGLTDDWVNYIYEGKGDTLWVCTNKGVCRYDGQNWSHFDGTNGLASNVAKCMIIDSEGNKWIGTDSGLYKFDGRRWTTYYSYDGLGSDNILSLSQDKDGQIWCGTENGVSVLKNGVWYTYTYSDGLPDDFVNMILVDDQNKKYVCTNGGGMACLP